MDKSLLSVLSNGMSSFLNLSFSGNINSEPVSMCYQKVEKILKLLKPTTEVLEKLFKALDQTIDELRELIEHQHLLSSKLYFVMQAEPLISRIQCLGLNILGQMKAPQDCILEDLGLETSSIIKKAIMEQREGVGPTSEILVKIAENLGLRTNQEVLIEAVALEKLKDNAEQTEKTVEAEYIDQMISVVTRMHERLILLKQAENSIPIPVPADLCCPLSLQLMMDPVFVASGQTYEHIHQELDQSRA